MKKAIVRLAHAAPKAVVIAALATAAAGIIAPSAASASGTSGSTNGCYAKWYTTYFQGNCEPATVSGQFELVGICDTQTDYYGDWKFISAGSTIIPFDDSECTFSVSRSYIQYSNG